MSERLTLSVAALNLLRRRKINLLQVGIILKVSPSEISRISHGKREFKLGQLLQLSRYVGLHPAAFIAVALNGSNEPIDPSIATAMNDIINKSNLRLDAVLSH